MRETESRRQEVNRRVDITRDLFDSGILAVLTWAESLVLFYLADRSGNLPNGKDYRISYASQNRIADDLGKGLRSINRAFRKLKRLEIIETEVRDPTKGRLLNTRIVEIDYLIEIAAEEAEKRGIPIRQNSVLNTPKQVDQYAKNGVLNTPKQVDQYAKNGVLEVKEELPIELTEEHLAPEAPLLSFSEWQKRLEKAGTNWHEREILFANLPAPTNLEGWLDILRETSRAKTPEGRKEPPGRQERAVVFATAFTHLFPKKGKPDYAMIKKTERKIGQISVLMQRMWKTAASEKVFVDCAEVMLYLGSSSWEKGNQPAQTAKRAKPQQEASADFKRRLKEKKEARENARTA